MSWVLLLVGVRDGCVELGVRRHFDLSAQIRYLMQLLNDRLMPLQRRLDHLGSFLFSLGQLFKPLGVLLFLLHQLLIILTCLLRLLYQLLNDLFTLMQGMAPLIICVVQGNTSFFFEQKYDLAERREICIFKV